MLRSITLAAFLAVNIVAAQETADYGVDCSFPVHSKEFKCGNLLGDRKKVYEEYMEGCRKKFGNKAGRCDETENDRLEMSVRQPQSMVNYTSTGFMKIRAPKEVMDLLLRHWETNKDSMKEETWGVGNIYTNNWASPTYMVSVEDTKLRGAGFGLKEAIWDAAKTTIEQWTGMELKPTSMYGIRVYTEGAILSPHVDRLPLVSSCIINVDQDVDEPWPLEVFDRSGKALNVTMEPGDMVLYESGSLIHGRPFPLVGRRFANIFIHFEPTGRPIADHSEAYLDELDDFLPPYLVPGSPEVANWVAHHPHGWKKPNPSAPIQQVNSPEGHHAAAIGDLEALKEIAKKNKRLLHTKDANGWAPIHEAVRGGHMEVVDFLITNGADKDFRIGTNGGSPLNLALAFHSRTHPVSKYLKKIGAQNIAEGEL